MKANNHLKAVAIACGLLTVAAPVAQAFDPDDAITARRSVMRVIGLNFGPMGAMVRGKIPFDVAIFKANAARIEAVSTMPIEDYFPDGSEDGDFLDTNALPEIWSDRASFEERLEAMREAVAKLAMATRSGDEAAMKTAFGTTGKRCKGCHDDFKVK